MQIETKEGGTERRVLLCCITKSSFLAKVVGKVPKDPFLSKWSNLIFSWCQSYFLKYTKAPLRNIESLFERWCKKVNDKDLFTLVSRFLQSLSDEYSQAKSIDTDFMLDMAESYFNQVALEKLEEELRLQRDRNGTELALNSVSSFQRINLKASVYVNILEDKAAQKEALETKERVLIKHQGPAAEFFDGEFVEDSFIGIMASAKGGKSFTLMDLAWRAMLQGKQVAYFQVGDMSKNQIMRRFHVRAAYRPIKAKIMKYPVGIVLPAGAKDIAMIDYEDRVFETDIEWKLAERAFSNLCKKTKGRIRLSCHPIKTVSTSDIKGILDGWERELNWKPKVIVVDYAGNLAPTDIKANPVDQVSYSWAILKQISEIKNACVITANQSNKEGFKSYTLTRSNFAESKYILAHVTAFMGVNCTDEEKSRGIIRYNFIVRRNEQFSESWCLHCGSCLSIANPIVVSCLNPI